VYESEKGKRMFDFEQSPEEARETGEILFQQKLKYHAGRLDENEIKKLQVLMKLNNSSLELSKEEWGFVCDKCILDDLADFENRHQEN
jgi:hypothetical protein